MHKAWRALGSNRDREINLLELWFADGEGRFIAGAPSPELVRAITPTLSDLALAGVSREVHLELSLPDARGVECRYDISIRPLPIEAAPRFAIAISPRRSEDAYRLRRFDLALQATHEAVWEWVVETGEVWWNERGGEIFGYEEGYPPSLEGWIQRIHPADRERVEATYRAATGSRAGVWEETYRVVRVDGKALEVVDRGIVERDGSGKAIRLVGVMTDVTEIRKAQLARDTAIERFEQIAKTVEDVIWLSDLDTGELLFLSPAFERVFGRSASEAPTFESLMSFVHPDDAAIVSEKIRPQVRVGFDESYRIVLPTGEVRWLRTRAEPVRGYGADSTRIAGVSTDITEHRRMEQELVQARKLDGIGRLAGGVAHDFNNLLTVVLSAAELALDLLDREHEAAAEIAEVVRAAERASQLTSQLLSFARRHVLRPVRLDLNELTADMDKLLTRVIGEQIHLVTSLSPDLAPVLADRGQIEQVLLNLAINARDAMPDGGRLTLETCNMRVEADYAVVHPELVPGDYVMIAVSDTGPGIPRELQEQVFEPFFTTKGPGKGTGLGLASCYGIIRQAGGQILLYSEEGSGTTFKILLPRTDHPAEPVAPPVASHLPRGNETILFVEDDEHVRRIGSRTLSKNGYHVIVAENGQQALELVAATNQSIHLLVTDVVMPSMGGRELAERLTDLSPGTQVLFTSGYTDNAIVHNGVLDADVDFLQKPYTPQDLLSKVRQMLDVSSHQTKDR